MKKTCWILALALCLTGFPAFGQEAAKPEVEKMNPALLVIDIQNEYLKYVPEQDKGMALFMINAAIGMFRSYGYPVVRIYHTDPKAGPKPGSKNFEFPKSVAVKPDDPQFIKNHPSAFKKTDLEKWLREREINTVFLCGLSAVGCVLATYHAALDLDFNALMIKDTLMSHKTAYTRSIEDMLDAVGYTALRLLLENSRK